MSFSTVEGERGLPAVGGAASFQSRVSSIAAIGLMSLLGLAMLTWYYSRAFSRQSLAQQSAQAASRSHVQSDLPLPSLGRIDAPQLAGASSALAQDPQSRLDVASEPVPESVRDKKATTSMVPPAIVSPSAATLLKSASQLAFERRLAGPPFARQSQSSTTMQEDAGLRATAEVASDPNPSSASVTSVSPAAAAPRQHGLSALLTPDIAAAAQARILPTERLLLSKGAFIDCTLETAIDTSLPGMTTCITATDTFGVDGKVVLLERGTKLVGETQADVQQGSSRVFVLWTEARTPAGVVVPLASPGTDELGRSGLSGHVNRHFWDRFGAAILISVIDVALQSGVHSGGGTIFYGPAASVDVLTDILKSTVNIAPTVVKNQGDRIQVLVARDLDFRSVYELHAR